MLPQTKTCPAVSSISIELGAFMATVSFSWANPSLMVEICQVEFNGTKTFHSPVESVVMEIFSSDSLLIMTSTSGAITLGTESVGDIKNVLVNNCIVKDSHRGFAVRAREGGTISNVRFSNSLVHTRTFSDMWWGHGEALHVTAFAWNDPGKIGDGNPERAFEGFVREIRFENLTIDSEAGILNWAARPELIEDIQYSGIKMKIGTRSKWDHRIDLRPNDIQNFVERAHNAVEAVNCTGVRFEGCEVIWDKSSREKYGELVHSEGSFGLEFAGIKESIA